MPRQRMLDARMLGAPPGYVGIYIRVSVYTILEPISTDRIRQSDDIQYNQANWARFEEGSKLESCIHVRIRQKRCQMKASTLYMLMENEKVQNVK
jgi:hypothetical protein